MRRALFILLPFLFVFSVKAQIPDGYYDGTEGLTGEALLDKLKEIITNGHTTNDYDDLYTYYESTDRVPNTNIVWDMYSMDGNCNAEYYYHFNQGQECGTYSGEGDCYNREHSVPSSWFDRNYPMYADLFLVYPTDGYVNNRRSNYPYGEVDNPTWTSTNGSKLGTNSYPDGPNITVFEPIDAYKGDFARTYFYVATRYKDQIPSWDFSTNLAYVFNTDGTLQNWVVQMFLDWCELDPVSDKEIARNDSVYQIQGNRNPYIDHPEFISYIWGGSTPDDTGSSNTTIIDTLFYETFSTCPPSNWQIFAPSGSNSWRCSDYGYIYANAYNASAASNDWLISPAIDPNGKNQLKLNFRVYTKYNDDGVSYPPLHVYYSTDYDGVSDTSSATWHELSWTPPNENSQTWTSVSIDLPDLNQQFYIAFRYISSGTTADYCALWEVDNVLITATETLTTVKPLIKLDFKARIYPNPVTSNFAAVRLTLPQKSPVSIKLTSLDGKTSVVFSRKLLSSGNHLIRINIPQNSAKIWFVTINTKYGSKTLKLIKL